MTTPDCAVKWIEISRSALRHNASEVLALLAHYPWSREPEPGDSPADIPRSQVPDAVKPVPTLIAVVKANAYGHGLVLAGKEFEAVGATMLAATTPDELIALREGGITVPLLAFAPALPDAAYELAKRGVSLTVACEGDIAAAEAAGKAVGRTVPVHLKIDTGMGRLGALPDDAVGIARRIVCAENLTLEGVYTHFGRALEADQQPTRAQFDRFGKALAAIRSAGIDPGIRHCANSAALLRDPQYGLDAVRPGTILYGQYPSLNLPAKLELENPWTMKARVVAVRDVPAGTSVGYGAEFVTRRASRLAVIPVGYADGLTLEPTSATAGLRGVRRLVRDVVKGRGESVTVCGRRAPIVGRVAMQMITVDVTGIDGVQPGDVATVPARRVTASALLPRVAVE